jgi:hypothetical protein
MLENVMQERECADGQKYFHGFFFQGKSRISFLNFIKVKVLLKMHANQFFENFKKLKNRSTLKESFKIIINQF